jgi:hypothetical protein
MSELVFGIYVDHGEGKLHFPDAHKLGDLIAIDGSLIDAVLSICWDDYRKSIKKAKGAFRF